MNQPVHPDNPSSNAPGPDRSGFDNAGGNNTVPSRPFPSSSGPWSTPQRTHPASPLISSWVGLGVLAFAAVRTVLEHGFDLHAILNSKTPWFLGGAVVLGLISIIAGFFGWRMRTFHLDDQALVIEDRFIWHQTRTVLYRRIQAVDIKTPLMARLIGLCSLSIEIGSEGGVQVQYLRRPEVEALRSTLMHRATVAQDRPGSKAVGADDQTSGRSGGGALDQAPGQTTHEPTMASEQPLASQQRRQGQPSGMNDEQLRVLLKVPVSRQLLMIVTNATFLWLLFWVAVVVVSAIVAQEPLVTGGMLPLLLGIGGFVWSRLVKEWGFTVSTTRSGLRISRGLTDTINQSIPRDRVHGFVLDQPLLTRPFGLWRVQVNVMGYGTGDTDDNTVVLSAGTWAEAMGLIAQVWPSTSVPGQRLDDIVFEGVPRRAAWLLWWNQKVEQWALTSNFAATRHGRLHRRRTFTDHVRTQGLSLTMGPLARRMRLATIKLAAIDGPVTTEFRDLDQARAVQVLNEQPALARAMRAERETVGPGAHQGRDSVSMAP